MAPEVTFEVATVEHAEELARVMRDEDRAECKALRIAPVRAITTSLARSREAFAMLFDGEVAAVFGVVPVQRSTFVGPERGQAWALTGVAVSRYPKTFFYWSRRVVAALLERYGVLANMVDARYAAALRWLKRLGFEVLPPQPYGPEGALFCLAFARRR